jgi:hypothetical protein
MPSTSALVAHLLSDAMLDHRSAAVLFFWPDSAPASPPKKKGGEPSETGGGGFLIFVLSIGLITLFAAVALVVVALGPDAYSGGDGKLNQDLITTYLAFGRPFIVNTVNPLEGVFSQLYPLNIWLNPGFVQFLIFDHDTALVSSTAVFLLIFCLAIYALARTVDLPLGTAVISAQLGAFAFPPLYHEAGLFSNYDLMPGAALTVALFTLLLCVILRLREASWRSFGVAVALSTGLISYIVFNDPLTMGVIGFSFLLPFGVVVLEGRRAAVIGLRLLVLATTAAILYAVGLVDYILAMDHYTARYYFSPEFFRPQTTDFVSVLFDFPEAVRTYAFLVPGWLLGLLLCRGRQRLIAVMATLNFLWIVMYGAVYLFSTIYWFAPLPLYLEEYTIHLAGIGAVTGWVALLRWIVGVGGVAHLGRLVRWPSRSLVAVGAVLIVPVMIGIYAMRIPAWMHGIRHEPWVVEPELVTYLGDKIGLRDGAEFRGTAYIFALGYRDELTSVNLWRNSIPTLNEYSQTLTPAYEYFRTRLLMETSADSQHMKGMFSADRQFLIERINPRALEAVGTRFLLSTDNPSTFSKNYGDLHAEPRGQFIEKIPTATPDQDRVWYMYEFPDPNRGHFNPTVVRVATTARAILEGLRAPDFDWRRVAYLTEPLEEPLVSTHHVRMTVERGRVRLQAETESKALLVLPIQYSHCLMLEDAPNARLVRANFLLTGLIFTGPINAMIEFNYGFFNAACRKADFRDLEAMQVAADKYRMAPARDQHPLAVTNLQMLPGKIGEAIGRLKFLSPAR